MRSKRETEAQASIEFFIIFSVMILIVIILSIFLYQKVLQGNAIKEYMEGQRISNKIASAIDDVYIAGDGFSKIINLPARISLEDYQVKFYAHEPTVFIYTERQSWSSPLATPEINCTIEEKCSYSEGVITMYINESTNVRLVNKEGKIYFE
jgi:uncharacterized protein (UPF0333 family)